jgi:DNA-binding MarR family transcriptional regulator
MNHLPDDLPDCMVFWLAKAYQNAHGQFKTRLIPYGLTNLQHLVLEALWYRQGMTAAVLGKMLTLDKATLSGILDRMVKGGWIEKKPSDTDKRQLSIFTSPKANTLKDELINARKKANERLLATFSIEERLLLKRFLIDIAGIGHGT